MIACMIQYRDDRQPIPTESVMPGHATWLLFERVLVCMPQDWHPRIPVVKAFRIVKLQDVPRPVTLLDDEKKKHREDYKSISAIYGAHMWRTVTNMIVGLEASPLVEAGKMSDEEVNQLTVAFPRGAGSPVSHRSLTPSPAKIPPNAAHNLYMRHTSDIVITRLASIAASPAESISQSMHAQLASADYCTPQLQNRSKQVTIKQEPIANLDTEPEDDAQMEDAEQPTQPTAPAWVPAQQRPRANAAAPGRRPHSARVQENNQKKAEEERKAAEKAAADKAAAEQDLIRSISIHQEAGSARKPVRERKRVLSPTNAEMQPSRGRNVNTAAQSSAQAADEEMNVETESDDDDRSSDENYPAPGAANSASSPNKPGKQTDAERWRLWPLCPNEVCQPGWKATKPASMVSRCPVAARDERVSVNCN